MQCAKFCWHGLVAVASYGTVVLKVAVAKRLSFTMQHQLNNPATVKAAQIVG